MEKAVLLFTFVCSLILFSSDVSCLVCEDYTVYEFRNGEASRLSNLLMQPPPGSPQPGNNFNTACVNYTIYSGVYSIASGISVLGDSIVIKGVGPVLLRIGQNQDNTGRMGEPGLQFLGNGYVQMIGVDIDGSSGLLTFENVERLVIKSVIFRNFNQGSLDIFNCLKLDIEDCIFTNNGQELFIKSRRYQGGSGGLSLQYTEDLVFSTQPSFSLRNVSFIQNNAITTRNATSTFSEVASGTDFTGRGGAIFILLQNQKAVSGDIRNCLFESNRADLYGGAIYLAYNTETNNIIRITDTMFRNNSAFYAGGGVMVSFQVGGNDLRSNRVIMTRCNVEFNSAPYGGGIYFFVSISSGRSDGNLGTFSKFDNCSFTSNTALYFGAALGVTALNFFESKVDTQPSEINNCVFLNNVCQSGGVVSLSYFPFLFSGINILQNSTGPAIMIIGAKLHMRGEVTIANTSIDDSDKGALYIGSHGQLEVKRDTKLFFLNNIGHLGAAMVMSIPNLPTVYSQTFHNPLCPLQYEDRSVVPNKWKVDFNIERNVAIVGSGVYTNYLSLCSWSSNTSPHFDVLGTYRWDTFKYRHNINSAYTANTSSTLLLVQTPVVRTSVLKKQIESYPGQTVDIDIHGFGESGSLTYGLWRLSEDFNYLDFDPTVLITQNDLTDPVETSFVVDSFNANTNGIFQLTAKTLLIEDSSFQSLSIVLRDCPTGQSLAFSSVINNVQYSSCVCNTARKDILYCGIENVTLNGQLWAAQTSSDNSVDRLYTYPCPPRYCYCYLADTNPHSYCYNVYIEDSPSDSLCACGRSGVLCGECSGNETVGVSVLLNNCVSCDDGYSTLIVLFIVADVIVFILILIFMVPFPNWLLPAIFYIQLMPLLTENFPTTFEKIHPGMVYISSAISFYFPYDFCLYEGMTTIVSYSLRFIPAILASIIIPIGVLVRNRIYRPTTLHGVWLIVLLLFIPTLHASISVFNCPYVPIRENGVTTYEFRWFYNGSVTCFSDPDHGGLMLLGILGLILCILLVPVTFLVITDKIKYSRSLLHLREALVVHYKEELWFWPMLELFKRLLIVIFVIALPLNFFPVFFVLSIYHFITGMRMPYRTLLANCLEVALGAVLTLLILLPQVTVIQESLNVMTNKNLSLDVDVLDKCSVDLEQSPLSILLTPFYYAPLVIVMGIGIIQLLIYIIRYFRQKFFAQSGQDPSDVSRRKNSYSFDISNPRRGVSSTSVVLEMKELPDEIF